MTSLATLPALALLHPVANVGAGFTVHASTVVGVLALGALYHGGAGRAARAPSAGRRASFYAALVVLFLSLNGPLHDLSDTFLFSAHMVQHLVLTLVVPPLMLAGLTGDVLRPLLRPRWARLAAERLTGPVACFAIFNVVLAAWHLPPAYNLALAYHPVHIAQHLTFLAASVLMWWPLMSPLRELPRLSYPAQMLYCFLMVIPMSIVSIYITMADRVLYPAYAVAPRVLGISPMEDQHYGGLIMWIPGGLFFYGVMTVVFFKWAARGADEASAAQPA